MSMLVACIYANHLFAFQGALTEKKVAAIQGKFAALLVSLTTPSYY